MSRANAGRINVKFLVIVIAVLIVIGGGLAASALWVYRKDPQTYINKGDARVAAGEYQQAVNEYQRALQRLDKNEDKAEVAMKIADALINQKVDSTREAAETYRRVTTIWAQVARMVPHESELGQQTSQHLLEYFYDLAQTFGSIEAWNVLWKQADQMLRWSGERDLARKYRGIAQVNRMRALDMQAEDIAQAEKDLVTALNKDALDPELNYHYALWHLTESARYARLRDQEASVKAIAEGVRLMDQFVKDTAEDDVLAKQYLLQILYEASTRAQDRPMRERAEALAAQLEKQLLASDHPDVTLTVAKLIARLDGKTVETEIAGEMRPFRNGWLRERKLLEHVVEKHPDNKGALLTLAENYKRGQLWDKATATYEAVAKDEPMAVTVEALKVQEYQNQALFELGGIHLTRIAINPGKQQLKTEQLEKAAERLQTLTDRTNENNPLVRLLRGKIAYAAGTNDDLWDAVEHLTMADKLFGGRNVDALMLSADALARLGQTGAAMNRLEKVLRSPLIKVSFKLHAARQLAEMKEDLGELEEADSLVTKVLAITPANADAAIIKSRITLERAKTAEPEQKAEMYQLAYDVLKPALEDGSSAALRQQARVLVIQDRHDEARELLRAYLKQVPSDLGVFQELVAIEMNTDNKDKAKQMVEDRLAKSPDDERLKLILARVEGRRDDAARMQYDRIAAGVQEEHRKLLADYAFKLASGEDEEAEKLLDQLIEEYPENEQVIRLAFDRAIRLKAWDDAEVLVDSAVKAGFPEHDQKMMLGRLQMGRGNYEKARVTLTEAKDLRPLNSDTWLLRGNARRMTGDLQGAIEDYDKAVEIKPQNTVARRRMFEVYHMRQQHGDALQAIRDAAAVARNNIALQKEYLDYEGRFGSKQKAIEGRLELKKRAPKDWDNRRMLADLYMLIGQMEEAEQELDALLADSDKSLENIVAMAVFELKQGRFEKGKQLMREHIERQREADALSQRDWTAFARFLRGAGYPDEAEAAYREAQKLEPATLPVTREVAEWYLQRRSEEGMLAKSLVLFEQVVDQTLDPEVTRQLIEVLIDMGRLDDAQTRLNQLVAGQGESADTAVLQGRIYANQRENAKAIEAYDRAVALAPSNPQPYYRRALHRFHERDDATQAEVKADLIKAVELDETMIGPRELLVRWYTRFNEPVAAAEQLQELIEQRPDYPKARVALSELYLAQGKMNEMAKLLDDSERQLPGVPAWNQLRARLYRSTGRPDEAVDQLKAAYETRANPQTLGDYAQGLIKADRATRARQLLADQPDMVRQSAALLALRGWSEAELDNKDAALGAYAKAFEAAEGNAQQINYIVNVMQNNFDLDEVERFFEPRVKQDDTGLTKYVLHQIERRNGKVQQAIAGLEALSDELAEKDPRDLSVRIATLRLLASIYYEEKEFEKSAKVWQRLLEFRPEDMAALNNLAYIYADHMGEAEKALPLAERAHKLVRPDSQAQANVLDTLGWVQFKAGKKSEAELTLRLSIDRFEMWANRLHLARVLKDRRKIEEARDEAYAAKHLAKLAENGEAVKEIDAFLDSLQDAG